MVDLAEFQCLYLSNLLNSHPYVLWTGFHTAAQRGEYENSNRRVCLVETEVGRDMASAYLAVVA